MRGFAWFSGIMLACLGMTIGWSQSTFNPSFNPNPTPSFSEPPATGTVQPNPVLSPSDYKNMVNTMSQQTTANLQAQATQQLNTNSFNPQATAPGGQQQY